jgi:multidrug resistance efflux pump
MDEQTKRDFREVLRSKATYFPVSEADQLRARVAELEAELKQAKFDIQKWTAQANQLTVANDQKAGRIASMEQRLRETE